MNKLRKINYGVGVILAAQGFLVSCGLMIYSPLMYGLKTWPLVLLAAAFAFMNIRCFQISLRDFRRMGR